MCRVPRAAITGKKMPLPYVRQNPLFRRRSNFEKKDAEFIFASYHGMQESQLLQALFATVSGDTVRDNLRHWETVWDGDANLSK